MNIPCPHCEDGTIFTSRHGGNDPDTWPTHCNHCDGLGKITIYCEAFKCTDEATIYLDGDPYCSTHFNELINHA